MASGVGKTKAASALIVSLKYDGNKMNVFGNWWPGTKGKEANKEQRKSAVFSFSFFLRKEKSNNKILLSLIRPRVFKDSGIFFSSTFPRYRQILGAPRGDILFLVSSACRENALRWFKITRIV